MKSGLSWVLAGFFGALLIGIAADALAGPPRPSCYWHTGGRQTCETYCWSDCQGNPTEQAKCGPYCASLPWEE
ncbi:MAG: hypothetical protein KIS66_16300 [Fimbriimonadaceae bacterium]|nr:hypothetical protein [Fimbriimonadaceae bacterium]